jgi:hypothetical protein
MYVNPEAYAATRAGQLAPDGTLLIMADTRARLDAAGKTFERIPVAVADFRLHGGNASMIHLGKPREMEHILAAERQHVESRAIRRAYGITLFADPYLNGLADGILWIAARVWKQVMKG